MVEPKELGDAGRVTRVEAHSAVGGVNNAIPAT